jgi:hypothetical protein
MEGGKGNDVARGGKGSGDLANVVDRDTMDTAIGGPGTGDTCVIDSFSNRLIEDNADASCDFVVRTGPATPN